MGRVKIFVESKALEQAMRLFWLQGYANTSIKQLLTEMDMLNGSFYHCFKDKKTVFLKSLEHYNQQVTSRRFAALGRHDDFSLGIRDFFADIFETIESKDEPNGCLIVNSMVAEVLCEEELKTYLYHAHELYVQSLADKLQDSIDLKHTSLQLPAKQVAFILATYIQGLFGISRASVSIDQLKAQTEDFLLALKL